VEQTKERKTVRVGSSSADTRTQHIQNMKLTTTAKYIGLVEEREELSVSS
jgi:hypothetical protein